MDMKHADAILIMGSNMAECHPVAFRWVMQAKTRADNPCTVIHADPRFTRTSAMANIYAPVRAGSDIVFLGALIRRALEMHDAVLRKPADQRDATPSPGSPTPCWPTPAPSAPAPSATPSAGRSTPPACR